MIKVVIADDEVHICRLIQALIQWDSLGMELAGVAGNGIEALEMIREKEPDILITDIRMPGCSGLELISQAKDIIPDLQVVIISGYAHFEYAQQAMKYGVGDYILKPIKQDELNNTLSRMAERLKESQSIEDRLMISRQTDQDLRRLRKSLIENLIDGKIQTLSSETVSQVYHVAAGRDIMYQPIEIKIDQNLRITNDNTERVIYEKTERIFDDALEKVCTDHVISFRNMSAYGIMLYKTDMEDSIRNVLRDAMHKAEEEASPLGSFEFTIALGREVTDTDKIVGSFDELRAIAGNRLTDGTSRIYTESASTSHLNRNAMIEYFTSEIEKRSDTITQADAERIVGDMRSAAGAVPDASGFEIYQIVDEAGKAFISRVIKGSADKDIADFERDIDGCSSINTLFQALFNMMKERISERDKNLENATVRPIREAKKYVCDHFSESVTLEEISGILGFSSSYFSVLFKKETGEGFAKYLTQVRMDEAKRLLRETDIPVSQIAEKVGYQDQKHFTQTFHKTAGINPGEYRKLYG